MGVHLRCTRRQLPSKGGDWEACVSDTFLIKPTIWIVAFHWGNFIDKWYLTYNSMLPAAVGMPPPRLSKNSLTP